MNSEDLDLFVRVAELGSLSAAGRDLRLSPAVVSSRIQRLENRLGLRLLNRTTRQVNVTPDGETFYEHCLKILKTIEVAEDAVSARRNKPSGSLKVSAPTAFARLHVAPHTPAFLERFPDIQFQLIASDRFTSFIDEKVDLAIRIAELKDSSFVVRRLAENRRVLCAAPSYLADAPPLETLENLRQHNCLLLRFPGSQQYEWSLKDQDGKIHSLAVSGNMDSDNGEILTQWCLQGYGVALKSIWEIGPYLKDGRLKAVLPEITPVAHTIHTLYPHARFLPPRVRAFIDFMVETIGPTPYWERDVSLSHPSEHP